MDQYIAIDALKLKTIEASLSEKCTEGIWKSVYKHIHTYIYEGSKMFCNVN